MNKTILVIGANPRPESYAYKAVSRLREKNFKVIALGITSGKISDVDIINEFPRNLDIHTVTLYINPKRQECYYQDILDLKPERVIFNPGTENYEFENMLRKNNIEVLEQCTLVMLSLNIF